MRVQPVIDRLNAQCPLLGNRAAAAFSINAVDDLAADLPAAFVHPMLEQSAPPEGDLHVTQQVAGQVAVQIVTTNAGEQLEDVRDQVRTALLGWEGNYGNPFAFVRGDVLEVTRSVIWWRDIYTVNAHIRGGVQ